MRENNSAAFGGAPQLGARFARTPSGCCFLWAGFARSSQVSSCQCSSDQSIQGICPCAKGDAFCAQKKGGLRENLRWLHFSAQNLDQKRAPLKQGWAHVKKRVLIRTPKLTWRSTVATYHLNKHRICTIAVFIYVISHGNPSLAMSSTPCVCFDPPPPPGIELFFQWFLIWMFPPPGAGKHVVTLAKNGKNIPPGARGRGRGFIKQKSWNMQYWTSCSHYTSNTHDPSSSYSPSPHPPRASFDF